MAVLAGDLFMRALEREIRVIVLELHLGPAVQGVAGIALLPV